MGRFVGLPCGVGWVYLDFALFDLCLVIVFYLVVFRWFVLLVFDDVKLVVTDFAWVTVACGVGAC